MINRIYTRLSYLYHWIRFNGFQSRPVKEVFTDIYVNDKWSGDSLSGPGSDPKQTAGVIRALQEIIDQYEISSMLDIPCGDWAWMKHVDLSKVKYIGGDIVTEIIEQNQQYASPNIAFQVMNLLDQQLPKCDLVFCRDCLVHLSYHDVRRSIKNIANSGSRYLLTTTFPGRRNYNIKTGEWRPLDLQSFPFKLSQPLLIKNEGCTEGEGNFMDKSLALWDLRELKI